MAMVKNLPKKTWYNYWNVSTLHNISALRSVEDKPVK